MHKFVVAALLGSSALSCSRQPASQITSTDAHSYSQPERVRVRHVDLDLSVQFDKKTLRGTATLTIEPAAPGPLVLDTRDLRIEKAEAWAGQSWEETKFALGPADRILGAPLTIELPANATQVRNRRPFTPEAGFRFRIRR
ncbi:MAG: aminopeptidase, partial [Bryobacteraceae bacterium]